MQGFTNELGRMELPNATDLFRISGDVQSTSQIQDTGLSERQRSEADSFARLGNTNLSYFSGWMQMNRIHPCRWRAIGICGLMVLRSDPVVDVGSDEPGRMSAKMHNNVGNIGLADGSVQQLTSSGLQAAIAHSGTNVNRLAVRESATNTVRSILLREIGAVLWLIVLDEAVYTRAGGECGDAGGDAGKHGIAATQEFTEPNLPDDGDLNRPAKVLVPEADYERAFGLFYA